MEQPTELSGPGATAMGDPRMQAALLTKQKQDVSAQKKAIQDRIAELDKEKEALRQQLATLR